MDGGELVSRMLENLRQDFSEVKAEVHGNSERLAAIAQKMADHEREAERLEGDVEFVKEKAAALEELRRDVKAASVKLAEVEGRVRTLEELKTGVVSVKNAAIGGLGLLATALAIAAHFWR